jgi:hypothetical protein
VIRHKLAIKEQLVLPGTCLETWPLLGNYLHGYGESLFNKWGMQADLAKTRFVEDLHKELTSKYVLAKTELLVYSLA